MKFRNNPRYLLQRGSSGLRRWHLGVEEKEEMIPNLLDTKDSVTDEDIDEEEIEEPVEEEDIEVEEPEEEIDGVVESDEDIDQEENDIN